ncbi:glutamine--fructose-6-phosphate transaminase (isomerizing) [Candidatus Roizmanbacteria bacterium RIFOXYB2_FULL_38_10]|uniref:Glutamine--fructose-6-phosphate aminotransferase [isomerizing] n=1 Tax=Candidatus Roizmanbacteria bacterium RIFOXYD1_FULL_38_12 TaxID=1802093 RepID=A0A1F7L019_9BACT|nr:MAG: glutamine--fructose-6-phosphate transaminase (isomerizing) [Candidatus Roizmanbacteria bacterium RIFOXYA2_FULL_38_14]OGK63480.1 MAG: glutamine--fructose-6-phosphate transaminase (isomerizing) [Candidatus Roizmanbacteria bacterium RIFOXYA1_FULL_37_12]OGK65326.1 MAG: glutamine--fructose-6-phosphate transaminase (isomerizing) [Candidatus Roizmanbacteria bacterium RIFOXYB1_FULL_40_23]OGK67960.1 MAG: glutamine--fructose-6-phosphate transaminase (isomerizing) [Candidatus Roizmanbacteria bacter
MCGIFAVIEDKQNQAAQTVLAGLKKLEYRGYDSWGIAIKPMGGSTIQVDKHVGKIGIATTSLPDGSVAIGHTRWATHGGVTDTNAHPHLDCKKQIAVIHNGIVENYHELKIELIKKGHSFISETDTEVIAHLVEEKRKTMDLEEAVFSTFRELVGSNAIVVLDYQTGSVIACRNGSPLVVGFSPKETFLASDTTAFLNKTNSVYYLNDNEAVVVSKNERRIFDLIKQSYISFKKQTVDWTLEDTEKGGFPHFLLKEIMEEKKTIPQAFDSNKKTVEHVIKKMVSGYTPLLLGCGSAYYCALAAHYYFAQLGIDSKVVGGYEYLPFEKSISNKSIVFAISQSGETADTLIPAKEAKKRGAIVVAIVNSRGSSLERLADVTLPVGAGPEISVVSTKAFTAQLATLYAVANQYYERKPHTGLIRSSTQLKSKLKHWLNASLMSTVLNIAKRLLSEEHAYVIGKYNNYPAALEFALKLKETSYMHAEAFAAGELKHGVITLIQKGTPCFIMTDSGPSYGEICSSASQMKARGGYIIGVGPTRSPLFDEWIQTPDVDPRYSIFLNVIVGQLLGYYLGVGRGADPDKPRNLAKSVTVK